MSYSFENDLELNQSDQSEKYKPISTAENFVGSEISEFFLPQLKKVSN